MFAAVAALALLLAAFALLTGRPSESVVVRGTSPAHRLVPPGGSFPQPGPIQLAPHANTSAPFEWILLVLAIVALGFAAWLWTSWGRSGPPGVRI